MKKSSKWTKDKCYKIALKYNNKYDFQKNDGAALAAMYKNKWLDICDHMNLCENIKPRCIYVYEFENNHAYVGLTYDLNDRKRRHRKNGTIFEYMKETNLVPNIIQLTEYLEQTEAQLQEEKYVNKYKNDGWIILNKVKTGSIGSNIIFWTKEKCLEEALKYNNRTLFQKSSYAYLASYRNNWLDDVCSHMIDGKRKNNFWNYDSCKQHAKLCKNRYDFSKKYSGGYNLSKVKGWLNEFFISS